MGGVVGGKDEGGDGACVCVCVYGGGVILHQSSLKHGASTYIYTHHSSVV